MLVRSVRNEGQVVATALEERGIPYRLVGAQAFFERVEVRDLLAWLRLLSDPNDGRAVVRALVRPPVELGPVDLARATQIARRRKTDMISALAICLDSPDFPPESREKIESFLKLYRAAAKAFDEMRPDLFVHRLIERTGMRKQYLFSSRTESLERLVNIAKFADMAAAWVRREPGRSSRDFAGYVSAVAEAGLREEEAVVRGDPRAVRVMTMHGAKGLEFDCVYVLGVQQSRMPGSRRNRIDPVPDALLKESLPADSRDAHVAEMRRLLYVAMTRARKRLVLAWPAHSGSSDSTQKPSPFLEEAREAIGGEIEQRDEELLGIHEDLFAALRTMRDEVLGSVARTGAGMSEMRLDAHLEGIEAVARYLELLKLAALVERHPSPEELPAAIAEINQVISQIASEQQRERLAESNLDELLLKVEQDNSERRRLVAEQSELSVEAFLPIRGDGLMLSATDIEIYRTCPLKYKFARVYSIPKEQTLPQRFGILVHQVLERYHSLLSGDENGGIATPRSSDADKLRALFENGWRRLGFGDSNEERQLHEKAVAALGPLQRALRRPGVVAGLVRAQLLLPDRPAPAARPRRSDRQAPRRQLRADRLQDGQADDRRPSSRTTSSCRSTSSAPGRPGSSSRRARATTTCSTTRSCRWSRAPRTSSGSRRPRPRSRRASWPRTSSRSPRFLPAESVISS